MHPFAVLTEIIEARPDFLVFGTVGCCAAKASIVTGGWDKLMFALPVSIKIVLCTEAFSPHTICDFTSVGLFMTKDMLSNRARKSV